MLWQYGLNVSLTAPPVLQDHSGPFVEPIAIDGIATIDDVQKSVSEECLKGRYISSLFHKKRGEGVSCCDAQSQHLPGENLSTLSIIDACGEYSPKCQSHPKFSSPDILKP